MISVQEKHISVKERGKEERERRKKPEMPENKSIEQQQITNFLIPQKKLYLFIFAFVFRLLIKFIISAHIYIIIREWQQAFDWLPLEREATVAY